MTIARFQWSAPEQRWTPLPPNQTVEPVRQRITPPAWPAFARPRTRFHFVHRNRHPSPAAGRVGVLLDLSGHSGAHRPPGPFPHHYRPDIGSIGRSRLSDLHWGQKPAPGACPGQIRTGHEWQPADHSGSLQSAPVGLDCIDADGRWSVQRPGPVPPYPSQWLLNPPERPRLPQSLVPNPAPPGRCAAQRYPE